MDTKQVVEFASRHRSRIAMGAIGVAAFARAAAKRPDVAISMAQCVVAKFMGDAPPEEARLRVRDFWSEEFGTIGGKIGLNPQWFTGRTGPR